MKKAKLCVVVLVIFLTLAIVSLNLNNPINFSKDSDKSDTDLKLSTESGGGYIMDTNADYVWEEISSTGTNMTSISNEDDEYDSISFLGQDWNFTFYKTNYSEIYVSTNGWMSFTNKGDTGWFLETIPGQIRENLDCIALLAEDINLDEFDYGGGDVYYEFLGTFPNRYLVIEYHQAYDFMNEELIGDFQVLLYENGTIKFQYKTVNNLDGFDPIIGLDHGDMTNYNSYDANLPLTSKAIKFTFNSLIEMNYSLGFSENTQYCWKILGVNHAGMESVFGSNWEQKFGLFPGMSVNEKTKINVSLIWENSTHWEIIYDMWDWISTGSNFGSTPGSASTLMYRKEPLNYTQQHNLTNLIPLLLPKNCGVYLIHSDLTRSYEEIFYDEDTRELSIWVSFHDLSMTNYIYGYASYNENGLLTEIDLQYTSMGPSITALEMKLTTCAISVGGGDGNGDDDDDDIDAEILPLVLIIIISSIGAVAITIFVLIKKGIVDTSKFRIKRRSE